MNPSEQPPLTDKQHADKIRCLIKDLSAALKEANEAGLQIKLDLGGLGTPNWVVDFKDAAKIVRNY